MRRKRRCSGGVKPTSCSEQIRDANDDRADVVGIVVVGAAETREVAAAAAAPTQRIALRQKQHRCTARTLTKPTPTLLLL